MIFVRLEEINHITRLRENSIMQKQYRGSKRDAFGPVPIGNKDIRKE